MSQTRKYDQNKLQQTSYEHEKAPEKAGNILLAAAVVGIHRSRVVCCVGADTVVMLRRITVAV